MTQFIQLAHYGVISVSGQDQKSYLQGQLTCDLNQLEEKGWLAGCHCDAKGKMWSNFLLTQKDDTICLIMRRSILPKSLTALQKFGVFAQVEIADASDSLKVYGALEVLTEPHLGAIALSKSQSLILSEQTLEASTDTTAWQLQQIQAVRPELEAESMAENFVPQMLNQAELDAISFKKGCYIGQETVARMKYLGKQKRASFYLKGSAAQAQAGQELEVERNGNWRRAGQIVNAIELDGESHLIAVLAADANPSEHYRLAETQESKLILQPLPYALECQ